jgi:peptidoglycan hydrolase-like protein with peptidoglycan-binding domain
VIVLIFKTKKLSFIEIIAIISIIIMIMTFYSCSVKDDNLQANSMVDSEDTINNIQEEPTTTEKATEITTTTKVIDTTSPPLVNPLILKQGDKGDDVKNLQEKLSELGLYSGVVDGSFGPITNAAVIKLQETYKLTADGIVQGETWTALDNAIIELKSEVESPTKKAPAQNRKSSSNSITPIIPELKNCTHCHGRLQV